MPQGKAKGPTSLSLTKSYIYIHIALFLYNSLPLTSAPRESASFDIQFWFGEEGDR